MRFELMGAVIACVLAAAVELASFAVAPRCGLASTPGRSIGEVVRNGGCEPQVLARRFR